MLTELKCASEIGLPHEVTSQRELVARIATLELLVADLIELLWHVDSDGMEAMARDAVRDLDIQHTHFMPAGAENQRERLFGVLRDRSRRLSHRRQRGDPRHHEPARFADAD